MVYKDLSRKDILELIRDSHETLNSNDLKELASIYLTSLLHEYKNTIMDIHDLLFVMNKILLWNKHIQTGDDIWLAYNKISLGHYELTNLEWIKEILVEPYPLTLKNENEELSNYLRSKYIDEGPIKLCNYFDEFWELVLGRNISNIYYYKDEIIISLNCY